MAELAILKMGLGPARMPGCAARRAGQAQLSTFPVSAFPLSHFPLFIKASLTGSSFCKPFLSWYSRLRPTGSNSRDRGAYAGPLLLLNPETTGTMPAPGAAGGAPVYSAFFIRPSKIRPGTSFRARFRASA